MHLFCDFLEPKNDICNFEASLWWVFPKNWELLINLSLLKNEQVKVCFFTLESPYPYFCCKLRYMGMPYMYSEMQNKLSKTRESPLESMGQIISSRCPIATCDLKVCRCRKLIEIMKVCEYGRSRSFLDLRPRPFTYENWLFSETTGPF